MSCTCLVNRHTHTDHCPVAVENHRALRELEGFDVRCKGCNTGIILGPPLFPNHYNGGHGNGPFYCDGCWEAKVK